VLQWRVFLIIFAVLWSVIADLIVSIRTDLEDTLRVLAVTEIVPRAQLTPNRLQGVLQLCCFWIKRLVDRTEDRNIRIYEHNGETLSSSLTHCTDLERHTGRLGDQLHYSSCVASCCVNYNIHIDTVLFPAVGVCCLGRRVLLHVGHLQVWYLVTVVLHIVYWCKFSMYCNTECIHRCIYRLFQKELYSGIPNVTAWRVLRRRLHFFFFEFFKLFISNQNYIRFYKLICWNSVRRAKAYVKWWIVCTPLSVNIFLTIATQWHLDYRIFVILSINVTHSLLIFY
jgi:hypothetical protein